jgi:hypothetical protein
MNNNAPEGSASSTASPPENSGELRSETITCRSCGRIVSSDGSTVAPVNRIPANPPSPETCMAKDPSGNGSISETLPLNCTSSNPLFVETSMKRIFRDSDFQGLIHSTAWSTEEAVFLGMALLLGFDSALRIAAGELGPEAVARIKTALMRFHLGSLTPGALAGIA